MCLGTVNTLIDDWRLSLKLIAPLNPISHDGSMVLVNRLTKRGYIDGIHVTKQIAAPWIRHGS